MEVLKSRKSFTYKPHQIEDVEYFDNRHVYTKEIKYDRLLIQMTIYWSIDWRLLMNVGS